jgi:hypothetical protein
MSSKTLITKGQTQSLDDAGHLVIPQPPWRHQLSMFTPGLLSKSSRPADNLQQLSALSP